MFGAVKKYFTDSKKASQRQANLRTGVLVLAGIAVVGLGAKGKSGHHQATLQRHVSNHFMTHCKLAATAATATRQAGVLAGTASKLPPRGHQTAPSQVLTC